MTLTPDQQSPSPTMGITVMEVIGGCTGTGAGMGGRRGLADVSIMDNVIFSILTYNEYHFCHGHPSYEYDHHNPQSCGGAS